MTPTAADERFETLRIERSGPTAAIVLDRPASLNPLSTTCLRELARAARTLDGEPEVRAVVVRGEGRAFSAGADLSAFGASDGEAIPGRGGATAGREMVEAIEGMRAVTIAAVHGHCVGGGVLLALACDLRFTDPGTRFVIPEVDLGIPLTWGGVPRLVREVGPAATRDLVLTCRPFDADEALRIGLVSRVVDDVRTIAETEAEAMAVRARHAVSVTLAEVDAAADEMVSSRRSWSDDDVLAAALRDPEGRAAGAAYLRSRGFDA